MFCHNCGHKIIDNAEFCSECGTSVINKIDTNQQTLSQQLYKKNPFKPLWKKVKKIFNIVINFIINHKKPFMIGASACFAIIIGIVLFNNLYDFTKLSWDAYCDDCKIKYTEATVLNLKVSAYDKNNNEIKDIKFSTDFGEVEVEEDSVVWKLPEDTGTYKITAIAPSGKKITKEVNLIKINSNELFTGLQVEENNDPNLDSDNDGLIDTEEKKLGTNPYLMDSDYDGLPDYYEVNVSKTDPLKDDTDGDGINDGNEIVLGLDPLKIDSKDDGIKDGDRELVYTLNNDDNNITVEINGTGNIVSTNAEVFSNTTLDSMDGVLGKLYTFNTDGNLSSAKVTIKYDLDELLEKDINEENLSLYYFDLENKIFEIVPTEIDVESKTIVSTLSHFSSYVIADKEQINTNQVVDILFIIDNSISMYTEQQMIDRGYDNSSGAVGNDENFKRLTLSSKLVDMFTGNYRFGVAEFSGDYVNLTKFSDDKASVKDGINMMSSKFSSYLNGTKIVNALKSGINEFNTSYNGKYIIMLTDGIDTANNLSSQKDNIVKLANEKNIKICIIGLGNNIDYDDLSYIATNTGCKLYSSSKDDSLDEIYALVASDINYNLFDTDNDSKTDSFLIADSGFIVTRDGFKFKNYGTTQNSNGHCYGMALLANLYYRKELPNNLGYIKDGNLSGTHISNGYDLTNTDLYNYDINLYDFNWETEALKIYFNQPKDFWGGEVKDSTLYINSKYYEIFENAGITVKTVNCKESNNCPKDKFNKYQSVLIDIESEKLKESITDTEYEMLQTIWRLYILQYSDNKVSSTTDPDKTFALLESKLQNGEPALLFVSNGLHVINAVKLLRDEYDSNKYVIEVYDNNFPGVTRYVHVTKTKNVFNLFNASTWFADYQYSFMYDSNGDGKYATTKVLISTPTVE